MNKQSPLNISFANQKGGVGKSTISVLAASYFHFVQKINVLVVDCDKQHSISCMRKREKNLCASNSYFNKLISEQASKDPRQLYKILEVDLSDADERAQKAIIKAEEKGQPYDLVIYDLPGHVTAVDYLNLIVKMDAIYVPVTNDPNVLESSIEFIEMVAESFEYLVTPMDERSKVYVLWNNIDGRQKQNKLRYDAVVNDEIQDIKDKLSLTNLPFSLASLAKYSREITSPEVAEKSQPKQHYPIFRSTIFPMYSSSEDEDNKVLISFFDSILTDNRNE